MSIPSPQVVADSVQQQNNDLFYNAIERLCRRFITRESGDPAATNDRQSGYEINSIWINEGDNGIFICVDDTPGAAVWIELATSGGGGTPVVQTTQTLSNGETTGVAASAPATVDTYTAGGTDVKITEIIMSGQGAAVWRIKIDTVTEMEIRLSDGNRTENLRLSNWVLPAGSTIDIEVEHFRTGKTFDFQSTLIGYI